MVIGGMNLFSRIRHFIGKFAALVSAAKSAFDIRDVFFWVGLTMFGYGLYLFSPWISFSVVGILLMVISFLVGKK
jgi:hypothetical protein